MSKIAAVYARVSTRTQKEEGYSLESQTAEMLTWADQHGYEVPEEHVFQEDYSGTEEDRPKFDTIKDLAAQGEISTLLIHTWPRLSRDVDQQAMLRYFFEQKWQVPIVCVTEPELPPQIAKAHRTLMGLFADLENQARREATTRGRRAAAKEGKYVGSPPAFGHRVENKRILIDEDEAKVVSRIYEDYVGGGLTMKQITRNLNAEGIPTKKTSKGWSVSQVHKILSHPRYKGEGNYAGITVPYPAIVPESQWDDAQKTRASNKHFSKRNSKHVYPMAGLLYHECGYRMSTNTQYGNRYYYCSQGTSYPGLFESCGKNIPAEEVEESALLFLGVHLTADKDGLLKRYADALHWEREEGEELVHELESKIEGIERSRQTVISYHVREAISAEELEEQLEPYTRRKEELQRELEAARTTLELESVEAELEEFREDVTGVARGLAAGDAPPLDGQTSWFRRHFVRAYLHEDEEGYYVYIIPRWFREFEPHPVLTEEEKESAISFESPGSTRDSPC